MASHNFEVIEKSHSTPVSEIFEAVNPRGGRFLIEVLGKAGFGLWLDAFKQDMAVIAMLRHPCILETLDVGTLPDGTPVVVSERPAGLTLGRWLGQGRVAPPRAALELLADLADALGAAHEVGVSHGALGVDEILLIPDPQHPLGAPKLRGFGHRWLRAAAAFDGAPTMVPGTRVIPAVRREVAADIAALAAIADRLLTPLHRGPALAGVLRAAQLLGDDQRFATPLALIEAIERALRDREPEETISPRAAVPSPLRHRGVKRVLATALGTIAIAAGVHVLMSRAPTLRRGPAPNTPHAAAPPPRVAPVLPAATGAAAPHIPVGLRAATTTPVTSSRTVAAALSAPPVTRAIAAVVSPAPAAALSARASVRTAARPPKRFEVWSERDQKVIYVDATGVPVAAPEK